MFEFKSNLKFKVLLMFTIVFLLVVIGAIFTFQIVLDDLIIKLGSRFAEKQVLYDKERSLNPLLKEIYIAKKLASSKIVINWAKDENNRKYKKLGIRELEKFKNIFSN